MLLTFESALRVASLGFGVELPCRPPTMAFEIYGRGGAGFLTAQVGQVKNLFGNLGGK